MSDDTRDDNTSDLGDLIRHVPEWAHCDLSIRRLSGGITNRNFVVTVDRREYVVRLPGERTELLGIDRQREVEVARRAAHLQIGPPIFAELPGVGTLICELLPGYHLEGDEFVLRLDDVIDLVRTLHNSGPVGGAFPIHRVVEWHARDATNHGVTPPAAYHRLQRQSLRIEAAFAAAPMSLVPCHNDLLPGNVLFDRQRAWLLDYEYAGMNDLFFDLANLSVNCGLTPAADTRMLQLYFTQAQASHWARLQLMKVMSEFREGMWAVVQQAISTLDTDFVGYAHERLTNGESLAASADFDSWLRDAQRPMTA